VEAGASWAILPSSRRLSPPLAAWAAQRMPNAFEVRDGGRGFERDGTITATGWGARGRLHPAFVNDR